MKKIKSKIKSKIETGIIRSSPNPNLSPNLSPTHHPTPTRTLLFFPLGLLLFVHAETLARDEESPKLKPIPGIKVYLRFSAEELDPKNPGDSFVQCVIRNDSDKAIDVPTVYLGGWDQDMVLEAGRLRLVHWAGEKKQKFAHLQPGQEITVFKAPLRDVLLLGPKPPQNLRPKERRYYWSWDC